MTVTRWGALYRGRRFACAIGRGGIGHKRGEGDNVTPVGTHRLTDVYVRGDRLQLPGARVIGPRALWCDAPDHPDYNTQVQAPFGASAERMHRPDPLYDIVGVLDFNRAPVRPGKGSAIFLHVWRGPRVPTAGCIAFARVDLVWILERWTEGSRVVVRG
ncbi:L,D-transpeptidase family protein [Rhodobacteraceae bacterium KN286]|uniref:L,D-transpeptidase family protein n=1 Tax=Oceanomicrobium pacificus TaxID=2692916 RepID=A0A6B0TK49_9RHOB|nr:L,D-transpeptidase family protein [Oceanomicrobium pacificus]